MMEFMEKMKGELAILDGNILSRIWKHRVRVWRTCMLIEAKIQVSGKERNEALRRVSSFIASRPLHEIALFLFAQAFFRV